MTPKQTIELAKQAGLDDPIPFLAGSLKEAKLLRFATLVLDQYRAELLAGVEWPEPEGKTPHVRGGFDHWWTETQVQQMLAAAVLRARREALAGGQVEDNTLGEVVGCFDAAIAEGLYEAIAETTDERLKDLLEHRVMHAYYKAVGPTHPQASEPSNHCAQCQKPYRHCKTAEGCPKCAPGLSVSETEFQEPLVQRNPSTEAISIADACAPILKRNGPGNYELTLTMTNTGGYVAAHNIILKRTE